MPVYACACSHGSPKTVSLSRIKQLVLADLLYSGDYDDKLPIDLGSIAPVDPYVKNQEVALSNQPGQPPFRANLRLKGRDTKEFKEPNRIVLQFEQDPWPDGKHAVGFLDGHAKFLLDAAFRDAVYVRRGVVP